MQNYLPGTVIEFPMRSGISEFLQSLFAANGLVLSQVLQLTGLNTPTVQNWVKRKFVRPPVGKKYDCDQFCTIVIINMMSKTFQIDNLRKMLDYVEVLVPSAPTMIYTCFIEALQGLSLTDLQSDENIDRAIDEVIEAAEADDDVKKRLRQVIRIMLMAHVSSLIRNRAQELLFSLDI